jgi:hypothetical protein
MARISLRKVATKTRDKIFDGIVADSGDWRRDHLGASLIGHRCDRYLWLKFRWAAEPQPKEGEHYGRQLRLFTRGHRAESWLIDDMRAAGLKVHDREFGEQLMVSFGGHFGGSLDGIVKGVPEAPEAEHVLELKTHNRKSFDRMVDKGVKGAKPEHWAQMQVYMVGRKLERALYVAVCKDDDDLYCERIDLDEEAGLGLILKGHRIVSASEPPERLDKEQAPCVLTSKEGKRYECDFFGLCHGKTTPARSCRTCVSSTPVEGGTWTCGLDGSNLDSFAQRAGCMKQLTIPPIVNAQLTALDDRKRTATYHFGDGTSYAENVI